MALKENRPAGNSILSAPMPDDATLPEDIQNTLKSLPPINAFRMLANVPQSFTPFINLTKSLLQDGTINPSLREIAILRVACMTSSIYEWQQHFYLAKTHQVSDNKIDIIQNENPVSGLSQEENFICLLADELSVNAALSDATFKKLFEDYSTEQACEFIMLIGYFNMLSRYLNGTRVQIEETNPPEGRNSPLTK